MLGETITVCGKAVSNQLESELFALFLKRIKICSLEFIFSYVFDLLNLF